MSREARNLVWILAVVPWIWAFGYSQVLPSDMLWHLASGNWMLEHHQIATTDPFSFPFYGGPWLQTGWLGDIVLARWAQLWSLESLIIWKWLMMLGTFLLLFRVASRSAGGNPFWAAVTTIVAASVASPFLDIRHQLFTFLGYVTLLYLFWIGGRARWLIPVLVMLWANLHGGYFFGILVLAAVLLPEFVKVSDSRRRGVVLFLATVAASGVNPHGFHLMAFPIHFASQGENPFLAVAEWLPPFVQVGFTSRLFLPLAVVFVITAIVWSLKHRPVEPHHYGAILLAVVTLLMSLRARRFIPLFAMSSTLVLAPALTAFSRSWKMRAPHWLAPLLVFATGCGVLAPFPKDVKGAFRVTSAMDQYPQDVCNFLEANQIEGNFYNFYPFGGYLHYRGGGRWKTVIDGRADTVYSWQHFRGYLQVQQGRAGWKGLIRASGADFVVWPHNKQNLDLQLVRTGYWKLIYQDETSVLLARNDADVDFANLQPPPISAARLRGEAYIELAKRDFDRAIEILYDSIEMEPTRNAYRLLITALRLAGRHEEAQRAERERDRIFLSDYWFVKLFSPGV